MDKKNICNICGSNLIVVNGRFKCGACGAYAPVSITNDENILLVNAFQNIRLKRFDDAYEQFEDIARKYPDSSSAYWGLVCSEFGIVLEEDYDGKKIPSCYNTTYESFFENENYKKAYKLADNLEKEYYHTQATKIESIRKEWIEKASKESPYDIFLSYKSSDSDGNSTSDEKDVYELYHLLKDNGYKVFFSKVSLDNKIGEKYEPYIFNALNTSKVMIVFGSKPEYFESTWVKNEWSRYLKRIHNKLKANNSLIVIYKGFNPKHLPKLLSDRQAIDRNNMNFKDVLLNAIKNVFNDLINVPKIKRNEIKDIKAKEKAEFQTIKKKSLINNVGKIDKKTTQTYKINKRSIGTYSVPKLSESAESTLKIAKSYFEASDYETALKEYEKVLINDSNNSSALKGRILCLNKKKSFKDLFTLVPFKNIIEYTLLTNYFDYASKEDAEQVLALIVNYCKNEIHKDIESILQAYKLICEYNSIIVNEMHCFLINETIDLLDDKEVLSTIDIALKYLANDEHIYEKELKEIIRNAIKNGLFDVAKRYYVKLKYVTSFDYEYYSFDLCIRYNQETIYQAINQIESEKEIIIIERIINESSVEVSNDLLKACSLVGLQTLRTKAYQSAFFWVRYLLEYDYEYRAEFVKKAFEYCYENPSKEILNIFNYLIRIYTFDERLKVCVNFAEYSLKKEQYEVSNKYYSLVLEYDPYNIDAIYGKLCSILKTKSQEDVKKYLYLLNDLSLFEQLLAAYKNRQEDFEEVITSFSEACIAYVDFNNSIDLNIFKVFEGIISYYPEYMNDIYNNQIRKMAIACQKKKLWNYSERYYALSCSVDSNDYISYWGLLQSKLKCINNKELTHQYVMIDTLNEYNNTLNAASKCNANIDSYTKCLIDQKKWVKDSLKIKKIMKMVLSIGLISAVCVTTLILLFTLLIIPSIKYNNAMNLIAQKKYEEAREVLNDINYSDSKAQIAMIDANDAFKAGDYERGIDNIYKIGGSVNVYYDGDGGNLSKNDEVIKLLSYIDNTPNKVGYSFVRWNLQSYNLNFSNYHASIYLQAVYEINNYKITYELNGGVLNQPITTYNIENSITIQNPTKENFVFKGWSINGGKDLKKDYSLENESGNKYLEAIWVKRSYTITYNLNGAINNTNPEGYDYDSETITLKDPQKTGYTFLGWTTSDVITPTKGLTIEHNSTGNKTYTANWEANTYTITYDVNGGNSLSENAQNVVYDSNYTLVTPTRPGYTFLGWYSGTTKYTSGKWQTASDVTLKAKWEIIPYTITYNLNGATKNTNPEVYNYDSETITLVDPEKTGYTFLGWTTSEITTPTKGLTIEHNSTGDKSFTANWEANTYTITYDVNGGNELTNVEQEVTYGEEFTLIIPTRDGYTFDGWKKGNEKFKPSIWDYDSNITIVAQWEIFSYNISYIMNGGTNDYDNPLGYDYESNRIVLKSPKRKGYEFIGWTSDNITTPTKELIIEHNSIGDKTFTANWEANKYKIVYDVNGGDELEVIEQEVTYDDIVNLVTPTRYDYDFIGWNYNGKPFIDNVWSYDDNIILTANWSRIIHKITNIDEFLNIKNNLNGYYELKTNIDFSNETIEPIGSESNPFTGALFGNNYKISNYLLECNSNLGLFGYCDGAIFESINIETHMFISNNTTIENIGLFVGYGKNTLINHCSVNGELTFSNYADYFIDNVGLMAGYVANIKNCSAKGNVCANSVGGIVGSCESIEYSNSSVTVSGMKIGGLAYTVKKSCTYCAFDGVLITNSSMKRDDLKNTFTGGLFAYSDTDVYVFNCSTHGKAQTTGYPRFEGVVYTFGGITAYSKKNIIINNCCSTIESLFSGSTNKAYIGGLVGSCWGSLSINESYYYSNSLYVLTTGGSITIGGLVGHSSELTINNSFASVEKISGNCGSYYNWTYGTGYIVASFNTGNIINTYYNSNCVLGTPSYGVGGTSKCEEGIGIDVNSFVNSNFIFNSVGFDKTLWNVEDSYPYLLELSKKTILIHFDPNNDEYTGYQNDVIIKSENFYTVVVPNYHVAGYSFAGWKLEPSDNTLYGVGSKIKVGLNDITLHAVWEPNNYIVSLEANGGKILSNALQNVTYQSYFSLSVPEKDGYDFLGWYLLDDNSIQITNNNGDSLNAFDYFKNIKVIALWKAKNYKLTYDVNGGNSLENEEQEVTYDQEFTLITPTRTGYKFVEWLYNGKSFESGKWSIADNVTITAKWEIIPYTITFNLDGATMNNNPKVYNYDSETITLVDPEKPGYTFLGWTTSDVTTPTKGLTIAHNSTDNKEFTANWEANTYVITYDVNGGDALSETAQEVVYDSNCTLVTPTRPGYIFEGWFVETTKYVSGKWQTASDVTLKAKWEIIPYTITYNLDGATKNINPEGYNYDSETIILEDPEKPGYTFLGWTTSDVTTPTKGLTIEHNSTGNKEFTANWEANLNVIILKDSENTTVAYGYTNSYVRLPYIDELAENNLFVGWSSQESGEIEWGNEDLYFVGIDSSYTLFSNRKNINGYTTIETYEELQNMSLSGKYILMNDIDCGNNAWIPIGNYENPFNGELDGNGHTIYNIKTPVKKFYSYDLVLYDSKRVSDNRATNIRHNYTGLFGCSSGTIKNLNLIMCGVGSISQYHSSVGGWSDVTARYTLYFGCVTGYNLGTISNCTTDLYLDNLYYENISSTYSSTSYFIGGIAGLNTGTIKDCFSHISKSDNQTVDFSISPICSSTTITYYDSTTKTTQKIVSNPGTNCNYVINGKNDNLEFGVNKPIKIIADNRTIISWSKPYCPVIIPKIIFEKFGYIHDNWKIDDALYSVDNKIYLTYFYDELNVYPSYSPRNCSIIFDSENGEHSDVVFLETDKSILLPDCEFEYPAGYIFGGWKCSLNNLIYNAGYSYTADGNDVIFYAVWTPLTNSIKFMSNGGSGEMPQQEVKTDETVNLNKCSFVAPTGKYFAGWSISPSGEVNYFDCGSFTSGSASEYILYAIWKEI